MKKIIDIENIFNDFMGYDLFIVNSPLSAIYLTLQFLKQKGLIANKNDEILVPEQMPLNYYNNINHVAFPSTYYSENIKGFIVYHQNGFSQNMEMIMSSAFKNNQFIIEDCSESLISYVNGKRLGTFSNFAIFDLSKYFSTMYGGIILTKEKTFSDFISKFPKISSKIISNAYFISKLMYQKFPKFSLINTIKKMVDENSQICFQLNIKQENNLRKKLYESSINGRNNLIKTLQSINNINDIFLFNNDDKAPYSLYFKKNHSINSVLEQFKTIGKISKSKYDINQNILDSNFIDTFRVEINPNLNIKVISKIEKMIKHLT